MKIRYLESMVDYHFLICHITKDFRLYCQETLEFVNFTVHFKRITGSQKFNFEEFSTILARIGPDKNVRTAEVRISNEDNSNSVTLD